ncbi:pirin family protein [Saccharospirillum salsuginis]|uniref:Pirin family protein n=1 Tax=Saccharospirillum salsuginis TaxID=418750 RepID=A0A918KMJ7_9GAMM|nr:pirin family protein [Saccharospirillum salsuginis]GGX68672.1 hypothetical protein GCM10007392_40360 [Saccharospirillum salsuginis]
MSNMAKSVFQDCDQVEPSCTAIDRILEPRMSDLGGFSVRRLLPTRQQKKVGPWIFFDHMGPAEFPPGEGINVRPHPHIGLATVTYLFEGEMLHRDSLGTVQTIRPGDVNLMLAGRGIVHSERERPEALSNTRTQHGLQLWLALPKDKEESAPAFYHYPDADIPRVDVKGVPVRVMIGRAYGAVSPVKTFADTLYIEARLAKGQRLMLPEAQERAVYVVQGELKARDIALPAQSMAVLSDETGVKVEAVEDTWIAVIGGEALTRRYIDWNFVSSRKERIDQAREDWRAGRFDKVPGDEEEFIPLPE